MKTEILCFLLLVGATVGSAEPIKSPGFNGLPDDYDYNVVLKIGHLAKNSTLATEHRDAFDPELPTTISPTVPSKDESAYIDSPYYETTQESDLDEEQTEISLEDAELAVSKLDELIQKTKSQVAELEARIEDRAMINQPQYNDVESYIASTFNNGQIALNKIAVTQNRVESTIANLKEAMEVAPMDADIRSSLLSLYESVNNVLTNQQQAISDMLDKVETMGEEFYFENSEYENDGNNEEIEDPQYAPTEATTELSHFETTPYEYDEDYEYEISVEEAEMVIFNVTESIQQVKNMLKDLRALNEDDSDYAESLYDDIDDLLEESLDMIEVTQDRVEDVIYSLNDRVTEDNQDADPRLELLARYNIVDQNLLHQWKSLSNLTEEVASTRSSKWTSEDINEFEPPVDEEEPFEDLDDFEPPTEESIVDPDFEIPQEGDFFELTDEPYNSKQIEDFIDAANSAAADDEIDQESQSQLGKFLNSGTQDIDIEDIQQMMEVLKQPNTTLSTKDDEDMEKLFDSSVMDELLNGQSDVDTVDEISDPGKYDSADLDFKSLLEQYGLSDDVDPEDYKESDDNVSNDVTNEKIFELMKKLWNISDDDLNRAGEDYFENSVDDTDLLDPVSSLLPETESTSALNSVSSPENFPNFMIRSRVGYYVGPDDNADGITDDGAETYPLPPYDKFDINKSQKPFDNNLLPDGPSAEYNFNINESQEPFMPEPNEDNFFFPQLNLDNEENPTLFPIDFAINNVDNAVETEDIQADPLPGDYLSFEDIAKLSGSDSFVLLPPPSDSEEYGPVSIADETGRTADEESILPNDPVVKNVDIMSNESQGYNVVKILQAIAPSLNQSQAEVARDLIELMNDEKLEDYEELVDNLNEEDYYAKSDPILPKFWKDEKNEQQTTTAMISDEKGERKAYKVDHSFKFVFVALIAASIILVMVAIGIVLYRRSPRVRISDTVPYREMENDSPGSKDPRRCSKDVYSINV